MRERTFASNYLNHCLLHWTPLDVGCSSRVKSSSAGRRGCQCHCSLSDDNRDTNRSSTVHQAMMNRRDPVSSRVSRARTHRATRARVIRSRRAASARGRERRWERVRERTTVHSANLPPRLREHVRRIISAARIVGGFALARLLRITAERQRILGHSTLGKERTLCSHLCVTWSFQVFLSLACHLSLVSTSASTMTTTATTTAAATTTATRR